MGHVEVVRAMIELGVDVNDSFQGENALYSANGKMMVGMLVEAGQTSKHVELTPMDDHLSTRCDKRGIEPSAISWTTVPTSIPRTLPARRHCTRPYFGASGASVKATTAVTSF